MRPRRADRGQGKDDNSETIVRSWDAYLNNIIKFPQFYVNVVAFADTRDRAAMLINSVASEAVESGTYLVENLSDAYALSKPGMASENDNSNGSYESYASYGSTDSYGSYDYSGYGYDDVGHSDSPEEFDIYYMDTDVLGKRKEPENYVAKFLSLYTLEELRPMFSLPILYPGETIEKNKETDPDPGSVVHRIDETGTYQESMSLGVSQMGYDVVFPVRLFKKHAFIAGVPGAGKTNTMLYLVTELWKYTQQKIPFLVLEPAKQEYRALAQIDGMEDVLIFSPGADTYFPLHINPFQFPAGLTLAEHIANLNAVFAGAFELPPPSPHFIDTCIEKVYVEKGWNVNERYDGSPDKEFPTLQDLYESLEVAVAESHYDGETRGNLQSVLEVRIGSLLKREIGNVYNVKHSIIPPEEWLNRAAIIELEALGEGPANFMSLLLSTLIRESLKVRKINGGRKDGAGYKKEIEHVIFYEEAHNLIGPVTDMPGSDSVDPKVSATKYLVKMLAEVRALGEGIVIADQLPSVMAPEVLKNTGLKIGHRITAQDDRGILGGTMSASSDQLEEQGIFGTGEALIFYEGLMKPYKMKIHEWEKNVSKEKYDSPSDRELYERVKGTVTYREQITASKDIIKDKIHTDFGAREKQAREILNKIVMDDKKRGEKIVGISNLKNEIRTLEEKRKDDMNKKIRLLEDEAEKLNEKINGPHKDQIVRICKEADVLYESYMTMSDNYSDYQAEIRIKIIDDYLHFFSVIKELYKHVDVLDAIMKTTKRVREDVNRWIGYRGDSASEYTGSDVERLVDMSVSLSVFEMWSELYGFYRKYPVIQTKDQAKMMASEFLEIYTEYGKLAMSRKEGSDVQYYFMEMVAEMVLRFLQRYEGNDNVVFSQLYSETASIRNNILKLVDYHGGERKGSLAGYKRYYDVRNELEYFSIMRLRLEIAKLNRFFEENVKTGIISPEHYFNAVCEVFKELKQKVIFKPQSSRIYYTALYGWYTARLKALITMDMLDQIPDGRGKFKSAFSELQADGKLMFVLKNFDGAQTRIWNNYIELMKGI